ncbi:GntR family transcriptional regulator [Sphingomonas nostoxanthinifaciens]|uniref:GntR family transcriptional regulator n=1 Tax=Sphingomonas nostoxanthinifaciens TaxID=2872652 RepID=UPI001CC1D649|nr:GntR family transcriptional regulator [Sphingomonas nostoxanthinifaciens]UAK23455.1 GntR family transcriptional regulator [Sphingomonas nostoxanthinifaciens]
MTIIVRTLSDQLVDLVRDRILSGQVLADQPIRQDALAGELGVSKIPLREALARLEQEGLVHSLANRGFFVRPLSAGEATEVYELRVKLEPETMALAAERANEADRVHARAMLDTMYEAQGEAGDGVGAYNRAFHRALYAPSRQPVTINILDRLQVLSERYVRKHLEPLGRDERANQEHRDLIAAWLLRDGPTVTALARAHNQKTLDDLRQQLVQR